MTIERVYELAKEAKLADDDLLTMYAAVGDMLRANFGAKAVDSGVGGGQVDFWVRFGDVEYKLVMAPHRSLRPAS